MMSTERKNETQKRHAQRGHGHSMPTQNDFRQKKQKLSTRDNDDNFFTLHT
ncbi:hypothetical protein ACFL54_02290 [Planctomycetota bacterium]